MSNIQAVINRLNFYDAYLEPPLSRYLFGLGYPLSTLARLSEDQSLTFEVLTRISRSERRYIKGIRGKGIGRNPVTKPAVDYTQVAITYGRTIFDARDFY